MRNLLEDLKNRPKTAIAILIVAALVTAGLWGANAPKSPTTVSFSRGEVGMAQPPVAVDMMYGGGADAYGGKTVSPGMPVMMPYPTGGETAAEVDQKIIRNGYLDLRVDDVSDAAVRVGSIAEERGGFVQESSVSERGDGTHAGSVTVRVPVEKYDEAVAEIKKLATLVKTETSTGQDVTEQYSDLEAQLRNAQAQEETYLAILKQAKTVEDTLKVQQQLGMIRGQIESLQGRLKYLTNATAYSTINVSLQEEPAVRAPTKEFRLGTIVKEATQALVAAVQNIIAGLIWAVIVWGGILLPLGLIAWLIVRAMRKGGATKKK